MTPHDSTMTVAPGMDRPVAASTTTPAYGRRTVRRMGMHAGSKATQSAAIAPTVALDLTRIIVASRGCRFK
jgi:hypothetical protein